MDSSQDSTGSRRSFRAAVRHYLLNPAALGYLAVVAGVLAWIEAEVLFGDPGFAGVCAFLVTAPTSWLFLFLPGPLIWVALVVSALFQAAVLGAAYRGLTERSQRRAARPNSA
ncbi:SCO4225 family membrane protein [Streptomyces sp. NPDC048521]|uniref:SCO4225 family membrane protein n=1 Tax=Streptomyces sp. NPDC048521 TaxID=3365566 RepID=UPI00371CA452